MTKAELKESLFQELQKSLILPEAERKFWLENYDSLPFSAINFFYQKIRQANDAIDRCIDAGIESQPELMKKIEQDSKQIRKIYLQSKEAEEIVEEDSASILNQLEQL